MLATVALACSVVALAASVITYPGLEPCHDTDAAVWQDERVEKGDWHNAAVVSCDTRVGAGYPVAAFQDGMDFVSDERYATFAIAAAEAASILASITDPAFVRQYSLSSCVRYAHRYGIRAFKAPVAPGTLSCHGVRIWQRHGEELGTRRGVVILWCDGTGGWRGATFDGDTRSFSFVIPTRAAAEDYVRYALRYLRAADNARELVFALAGTGRIGQKSPPVSDLRH